MCKLCDRSDKLIQKYKSTERIGEATVEIMKSIEKAVKNGQSAEHFKPLLDKVLGTEMEERDKQTEAAWEDKK